MKRFVKVFIICGLSLISLVGCNKKYNKEDFIGKTSIEIVNEFGIFDYTGMPIEYDGLFKSCQCGYTIDEAKKGYLGTSSEVLYIITFDENGIAIYCEEGYRPGG